MPGCYHRKCIHSFVYEHVKWDIAVTFADIDVCVCRRSHYEGERNHKIFMNVTCADAVPLNVMSYVHMHIYVYRIPSVQSLQYSV